MKVFTVAVLCLTIGLSSAQSGTVQAQGTISAGSGTASGSFSGQLPSPSTFTRPIYSALQAGQQAVNGAITAGRQTFQQMMLNGAQGVSTGVNTGRNFMNTIHNAKVTGLQSGVSAAQGAIGAAAGTMSAIPVIGGMASQKLSMASDMVGLGGQAAQKALDNINTIENTKLSMKEQGINAAINGVASAGNVGFDMAQKIADAKFSAAAQGVASMEKMMGVGQNIAGQATGAIGSAMSTAQSFTGQAEGSLSNAVSTAEDLAGQAAGAMGTAVSTAQGIAGQAAGGRVSGSGQVSASSSGASGSGIWSMFG